MGEGTRVEDKEREGMIAEMLRDSKVVELPNDLSVNPVIHKGDAELDAPMVVNKMSSAGHVFVWDTRTFEKIPILYYMLPAKLRERRVDGSYRFTVTEPKEKPHRGTIKCLLHADDENRGHYNELGFRVCSKDNITNNWQRTRHMQLKHSKEWAAIESEKNEAKEKEQRDLQLAILGKLASPVAVQATPVKEEEAPLYVSEKDKRKAKVA